MHDIALHLFVRHDNLSLAEYSLPRGERFIRSQIIPQLMDAKFLNRAVRHARWLTSAARIGFAVFMLSATAQAQIAIQDGSPLTITHTTGTVLNQPFTVTTGAGVMVVVLEDKGAGLPEPVTLAWNGQTLTRDVQTAYTTGILRSLAIYHLYNPMAGTASITGTLGAGVSDQWVTAYTLSGVDTTTAPLTGSVNTGGNAAGVTSLSVNISGVASGSWAAASSEFANLGTVTVTGTSGTGTTVSDANDATTTATAGFVTGVSAGAVTLSNNFAPNTGLGPQKSNFAAVVFAPSLPAVNTPQMFGVKFLGNTTDAVTATAGVVPISGWNNVADASFTTGNILSSDGAVSATLTRSGSGRTKTWNSGAYPDGGNGSLMNGYNDPAPNTPATSVISGLTGAAYDVYLYTGGDIARPSSATDWLPNYTVNGTAYYTATLDGYDARLKMIQGVPVSQNSSTYPTTLVPGHYLKIDSVAPVGGTITISANSDNRTNRSPLNGIQIVRRGNAPQILVQPLAHRLYTGGAAQFQLAAEGSNPLVYCWRKNGVNLNDGGNISGSQTTSLTVAPLAVGDTGDYDVVVTNGSGSSTSQVAHLDAVVMSQADAAYEGWLASYLTTTANHETFISQSLVDRDFAFMWQQAFMIWMIEDTYNRTHSPDQKQLIDGLLNTFIWQNHSSLTWDGWDDDLEWGIIGLIRGYLITGNVAALNSAIYNWDAVMSRGWDSAFGGGIWEKLPIPTSKCALSNYPQIIAGLALYQVTGNTNYLTQCETIYAWARTNVFIATPEQAINGLALGQVNEGVEYASDGISLKVLTSDNAYNSGLLVNAACALYEVTANPQYLNDAILAANHQVNKSPIMNEEHVANGYFGAEQIVRGVARLASLNQNNLWPTYGPWLQAQCAAAWSDRRTDLNITWNKWLTVTPTGTTDLYAMDTESASLVQQVTPATIPGAFNSNNKLNGTIIGTTGSYQNSGSGREQVFDGDVTTYFDSPNANGSWAGLDLGVDSASMVTGIRYYPRNGWSARMVGGVFQGANQANFSDAVTLCTVTVSPPQGSYQLVPITVPRTFRYLRYLSPNGGWGDVAEVKFYGPGKPETLVTAAPVNLQTQRNATSSLIQWTPTFGAQSYEVKRSSTSGGPYQMAAGNVVGTSYTDAVSDQGSHYFYVVTGVSDSTVEGPDSTEVEAVDAYRAWAISNGLVPGAAGSAFNADGNGNGITNGIEYAVPTGLKVGPPVNSTVQLAADVRVDDFLSVVVQKSADLVSWTALPAMQVIGPSSTVAGFRTLSLTDVANTGTNRAFYRLQITR